MKIHFLPDKKDYNAAVKRFFIGLQNEIVEINFSERRHRKTFKYRVYLSEYNIWSDINGKNKRRIFTIYLKKTDVLQ